MNPTTNPTSAPQRPLRLGARVLLAGSVSRCQLALRVRLRGALHAFAALVVAAVGVAASGVATAAPPAPTLLGPLNAASVTVPATLSWSAVTDPSGAAIIGYNWRVSPAPGMAPVVGMDSTGGTTTRDSLSGLVAGAYFWQVQAVNSAGEQGVWSAVQSFNVTGAGPGAPATPVLNPTRGYSTFHPAESVHFSWSAVAGALTYRLEVSNDPNFPLGPVAPGIVTFWNDNIRGTTDGFVHDPSLGQGTFYARVFATDSDFAGGIRSLPSNVIQYTVFYNNPIGPAPALLSPINGETLTLPITLRWAHVPNPQAMGYVWQVARDSTFSTIEFSSNQYTEPLVLLQTLTSGPKFWRVLSQQGLSSLNLQTGASTNANTAWSATGRITVSAAPPVPVSVGVEGLSQPQVVYSGLPGRRIAVQLSGVAPSGGATVALSSSNPSLLPVPASVTVPSGAAVFLFEFSAGQAAAATPVTLAATLNGVTISSQITVMPPTLNDDPLQSGALTATGGTTMFGYVDLEGFGRAPAAGIVVNLSSSSPLAAVPNAVTIAGGAVGVGFQIQTSAVSSVTPVTITASYNGVATRWQITLTPGPAPTAFFVRPMSTTNGSQGVVSAGEGVGFDQTLQVTSSNPALASVPSVVTVFAGSGVGRFNITTVPVTARTVVTISVSGGGVSLAAPLTVFPSLPALASVSVNPSSVTGGATAIGSVRLASAAPAGGVGVNLGSQIPTVASMPASVTVPGGATTANFTVSTFPSALTSLRLSAVLDSVFLDTPLTVGPAAPPAVPVAPTLLSPATGATPAQPVSFDWNDVPNAVSYEIQVDDTSTIAAPYQASQVVSASQASIGNLPAQRLWWRVRAQNSAGVFGPFSATRSFTPQGAAAVASLSGLSVSPASVVGPASTTATASLSATAPAGGAVVALSSSHPTVAGVPASVSVPAGATSARFAVTTSAVGASTAVTLSAALAGVTRTAGLTVTPPGATPVNVALTVSATGRSGERITSSPAGISVTVGSTGSASFATGTAITLSVASGRDAIWSGACSSGGSKARSCTFTINGAAAVTGNVQ